MLAIKLQRIGKRHQPSYRVVVAKKRSKMAGPPVEDLGSYNPFTKAAALKKERIIYWMEVGAQPTPSVHNFLIAQGVMSGPKIKIRIRKSTKNNTKQEETKAVPQVPAESTTEASS